MKKKFSDVYCCLAVPIVRILGDCIAFFYFEYV